MSEEDTKKRIVSDYQILVTNDELLQKSGIYYQFDDDNLYHMTAMILGPEKTPYHGGFYLFDITFPKEYPNLPPKFVYYTNYRNIRFNPNLYCNGNVCLSLLNTWSGSGEGWTPSNNIMAVFISIQGMVLNEYPLINEPGHDNIGQDHRDYNKVLTHENLYTAVCRMMEHTPSGFGHFTVIMKKHFLNNIKMYLATVADLHKKYKKTKTFQCNYSSNSTSNEYEYIYEHMIKLAKKYSKELDITIELPTITSLKEAEPEPTTVTASTATVAETKDVKINKCQGKKANGADCHYFGGAEGYCKIHLDQKK